jgi:hypothetical protein
VLTEALHALLRVCWFGGRAELWPPFDAVAARLGPNVPASLDLASKIVADPVRTAASALKQLDAVIADLAEETDPVRIMRIADSCGFADRYGPCRAALWRVVRDGREGHAVGSAIRPAMSCGPPARPGRTPPGPPASSSPRKSARSRCWRPRA